MGKQKLKARSGVTLIEMLLTVALFSFLVVGIVLAINAPGYIKGKRDAQRISDLFSMQTAIDNLIIDNKTPPGNLCQEYSGSIPLGNQLRLDPRNTDPFVYKYRHNGNQYELNAVLEQNKRRMENSMDGGDNNDYYEVGTNKTIIGAVCS